MLCDCCQPKLLEIKAPYSARHEKIRDNTKIMYLKSGTLSRDSSDGYYSQIQGTMALTGTALCDFVVWTEVDLVVVTIPFDAQYWTSLEPQLDKFFTTFVVPELFQRQLKYSMLPLSDSKLDTNQCELDSTEDWDLDIRDKDLVAAVQDAVQDSVQDVASAFPSATDTRDLGATICSGPCGCILPEPDYVAPDNSDASVGCECPCGCNAWSCWNCARYDQDMADEDISWACVKCVRECECVYDNM